MPVGHQLNNKSQLLKKKRTLSVYDTLFGLHPHVLSPNWWAVSAKRNLLLLGVHYAAFTTKSNIVTKTHHFPFIFNGGPVLQL